jgi:cell division protein FtsZ
LRQGVQGISELITETGLINVDFSHIKNVMQQGGGALLAIAPALVRTALSRQSKSAASSAARGNRLVFSHAYDRELYRSANMSFRDVTDALQLLQEASGFHAEIIPGVITDARMEDRVQLILIVTGIGVKKNTPTKSQPEMIFREPATQTPVRHQLPRRSPIIRIKMRFCRNTGSGYQ